MTYKDIELTITVSSGAGSANTEFCRGTGTLFYVKPVAETNTYDISFTDSKSRIVRNYTGEQGTLRNTDPLPMVGKYTVAIANGSADGVYTVFVRVEERP